MTECGCNEYNELTRRRFLGLSAGAGAASFLGLLNPALLYAKGGAASRADHVILLWMAGGMSHIDTLDPKPGTETGGPFSTAKTAAKGIEISEHLPQLAREFKDISLIRSLTSREGSHERATYLMHTGYAPMGSFQHSALGSTVVKMAGRDHRDLPPYVNIGGQTWPAGHLGPEFSPFHVGDPQDPLENLEYHRGVDERRFKDRLTLLRQLDKKFAKTHGGKEVVQAYADHYQAAFQLMKSPGVAAFDLSKEEESVRERYGLTYFGQGCLLARRLVQTGVRFVEVTMGGWDTHNENFKTVQEKSADLDRAVSVLISDLRQRDLLPRTLVLLCSEFGRTPKITDTQGRDHWPRVWSAMLVGGGIVGGRVIGQSTAGGEEVAKDPVQVGQLHATICKALDIDHTAMNYAPDGRPIRVVQDANMQPIQDLF